MCGSPIVQLEIYEWWYYWSGYPVEQLLGYANGPDVYDESAFPSLKPDIDLYGPPRSSRKQRGWYQVMIPLSNRPSTSSTGDPKPRASPSDIPPELFDTILEHLQQSGDIDKHVLVQCGSVCRHWAKACQGRLFAEVKLRSREDALKLLDFLQNPESAVSRYLQWIGIPVILQTDAPWLHLISVIGDRTTHDIDTSWVQLRGPLLPGQRSLRSIHHALPRSLPRHFSRHIRYLSLKDIRFQKLGDLMHLVWEMPHLQELECSKVTWGLFPIATTTRRRKPSDTFRSTGLNVRLIEGCGPCSVEACVRLSSCCLNRNDPFLSSDDLTRVLTLVRAADKVVDGAQASSQVWSHGFCSSVGSADHQQYVEFLDRFRKNATPPYPTGEWSIDTVIVNFRRIQEGSGLATRPEVNWMDLDWAGMGQIASSFPALKRVVVGLESREDMFVFDKRVAEVHMPHVRKYGMFKYAIWDPNEPDRYGEKGTWLRVTPDLDDVQVSGYRERELERVWDQILPSIHDVKHISPSRCIAKAATESQLTVHV